MKRLFLSIGILLCLLFASLATSQWVTNLSDNLAVQLEFAQSCAEQENWQRTLEILEHAKSQWHEEQSRLFVLLQHKDIDQVYLSFDLLFCYAKQKDLKNYLPTSEKALFQLDILAKMESPCLQNVL